MASPADLSHVGIQPEFAALKVDSWPAELPGIPKETQVLDCKPTNVKD